MNNDEKKYVKNCLKICPINNAMDVPIAAPIPEQRFIKGMEIIKFKIAIIK